MYQVLPKESAPIIFNCLFTTYALEPQHTSKFRAYKKLNAPIILNCVCSVLLEPVHSFSLGIFVCFVGGWGGEMLSISASNWKLVKQHHSRMIQQPLSSFTVYHKTGLGKQQCLEEKKPTQRIAAGEQYQKGAEGIILTWRLRSRLDDLIDGFQCPSFPAESQGSAVRIQPPQLNKWLCIDWTTLSVSVCTPAACCHLREAMVLLWHKTQKLFHSRQELIQNWRWNFMTIYNRKQRKQSEAMSLPVINQKVGFSHSYSKRHTHKAAH